MNVETNIGVVTFKPIEIIVKIKITSQSELTEFINYGGDPRTVEDNNGNDCDSLTELLSEICEKVANSVDY